TRASYPQARFHAAPAAARVYARARSPRNRLAPQKDDCPRKSARGAIKFAVVDRGAAAKLVCEKLHKHVATLGRQRFRQRDKLGDLLVGQAKDARHEDSLAQRVAPRHRFRCPPWVAV